MSELDQTIEELEAEVLAELEEASQPDDSGVPSEKDDKKNEADDLGGADEEGSDKDREIGKKASAAAKKDTAPKAKPSDASAKMEAAHEDEDEEMEEEEEIMSKKDLMAAMSKKMEGMNKEDLHATYMKMGYHEGFEVDEEVLENHIKEIDVSSDVRALVDGEDLSEEFKEKAATIFEAAVKSKTRTELARIVENQQAAMAVEIEEYKDTLSEKVDQYLDYVVEEWMKENELAIERGLKGEIAEDFISGLKQLFEDHYIDVPNEKYNVLEAQSDKIAELEEQLNSVMENNIKMNSANSELVREQVIAEVVSGLADTEIEKFKSLTEEIDFKDQDTFREKLDILKESYFPKVSSDETYDNDDDYGSAEQDIDTTDAMKAYMSAIGRTEKRIKGAV
jgi:hypothetical protein